jgi:hypothetical protein
MAMTDALHTTQIHTYVFCILGLFTGTNNSVTILRLKFSDNVPLALVNHVTLKGDNARYFLSKSSMIFQKSLPTNVPRQRGVTSNPVHVLMAHRR